VTSQVSDEDGNWHPGAITTLVDFIIGATIRSVHGFLKVSVEINVSFYSTAKIQEEVIIEGKIMGETGKLSSVLVEVRRKNNGELIALGKQWMASNKVLTKKPSKL